MGAINFDFDAVTDEPERAESHSPEISKLAVLAEAHGQIAPRPGPDVSKLAGLAGAPPRFSRPADPLKQPYPPANDANLLTFFDDTATGSQAAASALDASPSAEAATNTESRVLNEPGQLREWRDAFSAIDRDRPPKGYQDDLWRHLHCDGLAFLGTWGEQAVALGWSTLDLFGVHRLAPAANYSAIGLVPLLRGSVVIAMTADSATIQRGTGARLTFVRHPEHPDAVPGWALLFQ